MRTLLNPQNVHKLRTEVLQPLVTTSGIRAWIVGGCVRDMIHDEGVNDIDLLCTDATTLISSLDKYFKDNDIDHTIHTMSNGHATVISIDSRSIFGNFIIAPPRFTIEVSQMDPIDTSLRQDALLRDFICNSWYMDVEEGVPFNPLLSKSTVYGAGDKYIYPCDGHKTIFDNPVRVYRALDLMCRGYMPTYELSETLKAFIDSEGCTYDYREACLQIVDKIFHRLAGGGYKIHDVIYAFNYMEELGAWGRMIHPAFDLMKAIIHNNRYHHDSIWQHTMEVLYNMATHTVRDIHGATMTPSQYDYWVALLHDIGKTATLTCGEDGITHFYGHQHSSVTIAEEILKDSPLAKRHAGYVTGLIEHHMDTKVFGEDPIPSNKYKHIRKLQWELGNEIVVNHFLVINHADCQASERGNSKNTSNIIRAIRDMAFEHGEPAWEIYKIPLTGNDIMVEFPHEPVTNIGKYIKQLYKVTFSHPGDYDTKEKCLHYISTLINTGWIRK